MSRQQATNFDAEPPVLGYLFYARIYSRLGFAPPPSNWGGEVRAITVLFWQKGRRRACDIVVFPPAAVKFRHVTMSDFSNLLLQTLQRCQGLMELGLWEEAEAELDRLPEGLRQTKEVLGHRLLLLMASSEWYKATALALGLCQQFPDRNDFKLMYVQSAANIGLNREALEILDGSPDHIWGNWQAWHLRAVIQTRLGQHHQAKDSLKQCLVLAPDRKLEVLNDPVFEALW